MKKNRFLFSGILALTLIFGFVLTGCPNLNGSGDESADRSALEAAITAAEAAKAGVLIARSKADVASGLGWVTQADMDTLDAAIAAAKGTPGGAAQAEVVAAVTTLNKAVTDFTAKINTDGTKTSGFTQTELTALIELAKGIKEGVEVSADGTDKAPSVMWVTQAALTAFNGAITGAENAGADHDSVYKALVSAINTFKGAKQSGKKANTITITGLPAYEGQRIVGVGLFDTQEIKGSPAISNNDGPVVKDGTVKVSLYTRAGENSSSYNTPWAGTGSYYVAFQIGDNAKAFITNGKKSFVSHDITARFDEFRATEIPNNNGNNGRGEQIGKMSGTISLTDIPDPKPGGISISAFISDSGGYWYSYDSQIDLSGISGSKADNIAWTIPLYEQDSGGSLKDRTGTAAVSFRLYVQPSGSNNGFEIQLSEKSVDLSGKSDIQAGSLGQVSIASITLSGTIKISNGGNPVPNVGITAYKKTGNGRSGIGYAHLESPDTGSASWSIRAAAQEPGTEVTFEVYASDADGNTIFSKEFSPDKTTSVSNQPVSGIVLDAGDVSVGRLSGTVTFTNMPSPAPYRIYLNVRYRDANDNWKYIGSSSTVTVSGAAGTWSIPRDDDFLAALGDSSKELTFQFYMQVKEDESSLSIAEVKSAVSENNLASINLGTVSLAYVTLSGTINVNQGGSPIPKVYISVQGQNNSLAQISLSSPAANTPWSVNIPALGGEKVSFYVYGYDSAGSAVFNRPLEPAATASVYAQSISGIALDIGDVSVLSAPTGLKAEIADYSANTVILNWTSVSEATSYKVYRATSAGGSYTSLGNSSGSYSHVDSGLSPGIYYYKVTAVNSSGESQQSGAVSITVSGGGSGGGETLTPDIDSALVGAWKDNLTGAVLTATFTSSTVTWGGSAGASLNTLVATYQAYGSFAWVVKNGNIDLVYIDPYLGRQSYTCYTYTINGSGELVLSTGGYPFVTMVKD